MIEGIVLAAGRSRRAEVFKPAYCYRGQPLLVHAVSGLGPWCERLIVVAGNRHDEIAALLADCPPIDIVVNPAPADGMFSSVRVGVAALDPALRGFFVLPVDCPLVGAKVFEALLDAFASHDGRRAVVPEYEGRGGHPVLLPAGARRAVLEAVTQATLRTVVRDVGMVRVPVTSSEVLMDLDTRADLDALT